MRLHIQSMDLLIQLLGRPQVERRGLVVKPRGRKTWALFAYLVLSGAPPARRLLADLLFPEADDPLGALRWTLSDLRRLLRDQAIIEGDPVRLVLPANIVIDTQVLTRGTWVEAVRLPGLGRDLIEGQDFPASPSFELWLASERRHLGVAAESVLREAAMSSLARNESATASEYASRLVTLNPYDENHHVLFIRSLSLLGDRLGADRHVEYATDLLRRELGVDPIAVLRMAAIPTPVSEGRGEVAPAVLARVEAGEAAVAAGALESGLNSLRQAVQEARRLGDRQLLARSLVALGSTLVHAARGTDEEGAAALFEAGGLAEEPGDRSIAATARRELAWIEFLRARHDRAYRFLDEASVLAGDDDEEQAWVEMIRGACYTDTADYASALSPLGSAVERARRAGAIRPAALAEAHIGRWHLLRGELDEARVALHRALDAAREGGWTTFVPWPESLLADADLRAGAVEDAAAGFEHAFALGCQIGDPCWESIAARGLGLVAAAQGNSAAALEWLEDALRRCRRLPDSWLWVEAYALEALCSVAVDSGAPSSSRWVAELEVLAAKAGLRELLTRATMHRARLGDAGASEAATFLAAGIENPALIAELAGSIASSS
jgi:DNA-binding SARP family transcriptional activator